MELTASVIKSIIEADKAFFSDPDHLQEDGYVSTGKIENLLLGSYGMQKNPTPQPILRSDVRLHENDLAGMFGVSRGLEMVSWCQTNDPALLRWLTTDGIPITSTAATDLQSLVTRGLMNATEAAQICAMRNTPDPSWQPEIPIPPKLVLMSEENPDGYEITATMQTTIKNEKDEDETRTVVCPMSVIINQALGRK